MTRTSTSKRRNGTVFAPLDEGFARDAYSFLTDWEGVISDQNCERHEVEFNLAPVDESVAEFAGAMLESFADFLEATVGDDAVSSEAQKANARVYREIAAAVARAPFGNSALVLRPEDLGGRFHRPHNASQRVWTNATVAGFLLAQAARTVEAARPEDLLVRLRPMPSASAFRDAEELLSLAPGGRLGARLTEILPQLRHVRAIERGDERPLSSPEAHEAAMADPEFQALSEDTYRARHGRELKDSSALTQRHWTHRLAGIWMQRSPESIPLSHDDVEQIRHALAHPRHEWCRPPLIRGEWSNLESEDALSVLCLVSAYHRVGQSGQPFAVAWFCDRVRTCPLMCFGGAAILVEVQGQPEGATCGIASFVITDHGPSLASGGSDWLHDLNAVVGPHLNDPHARLDYLRLFMNCVRNGAERFQTIEHPEDGGDRFRNNAARELCSTHARPIAAEGLDDEGRWLYRATVLFEAALFVAVIAMSSDGMLEMTDDTMIGEGLNIRAERMVGPFVVLAGART
ncbi:MAG: hypothetical protein U1E18_28835 [Brevundimonas sp.]|uniref:hypothetical protein n=1 Tax=Brevundimonas sp. TaxID=1871086 RepID=UPI002AB9FBA7|nr:hypothetical protein [Brevundimonas sp.]MDZ4113581.1 hypothetical protein [Brevundimonas sp.]